MQIKRFSSKLRFLKMYLMNHSKFIEMLASWQFLFKTYKLYFWCFYSMKTIYSLNWKISHDAIYVVHLKKENGVRFKAMFMWNLKVLLFIYLYIMTGFVRKTNILMTSLKVHDKLSKIRDTSYWIIDMVHKENEGQKFWDAFVLCIWIDLFAETFKYWYCITDWIMIIRNISDDSSNSILVYNKTSYVNVPQICN